jgi:hypothetical protein
MASTDRKRFVSGDAVPGPAGLGIKLWSCPHCGRTGTLIGHGFLRGYEEQGQGIAQRGRRIFCSDRYRRQGCGRTFSVLAATALAGFVVRTVTLFRFVEKVLAGLTRKTAWQAATRGALSLSSGYRLWRRMQNEQSALRSRLCRQCAPPVCPSPEPLAALLAHLRVLLPAATCLFTAFQTCFQRGLFG